MDETTTPEVAGTAAAAPPVIRAEGLCKTYGAGSARIEALRGVDINVAAGEIVAVMGASGSGKSTLLHLVSGLDRPSAGTVWFQDRDLAEVPADELAALRATSMGFVLQRDNLVSSLTVRENVALPLALAGTSWGAALRQADEVLAQVELSHRAGAWPTEVSGGEAQRAAVARACSSQPVVIFADEPTGALDSASGKAVLSLFREMVTRGQAAALLVTHDHNVGDIAERVVTIRDGLADG